MRPTASAKNQIFALIHRRESWQQLKESLADAISTRTFSLELLLCLHAQAVSSGLHHNLYISSLLIAKYFASGDAAAARLVFDCHPGKRTKPLLWNSLISGYLRRGSPRLALDVFWEMMRSSPAECQPDKHSFHLAITACNRLSEFERGFEVGNLAWSRGLQSELLVATGLVSLYAKAGELFSARMVFDEMPVRDSVSWNAMISAYSQAGFLPEAMELFKKMRIVHGFCITESSLVSLVSCCGQLVRVQNGDGLHALVIKAGFHSNQLVLNSLLEMNLKCSRLDIAVKFFDQMGSKDLVSWSSMIGGYVKNDHPSEALKMFHLLVSIAGFEPTQSILLNALLACSALGDWQTGMWIEMTYLVCNGDGLASESSLITTLIYAYAKCRKMDFALKFLEKNERVKWDVIAWNAAIKACAEVGDIHWVFELLRMMQRRGIEMDRATILSMLPAIATIPSQRKGAETHALIVKRGFESERTIANSLIDTYARFGSLDDSHKVFEGIREKNVVSWSSMIGAYVWNGNSDGGFDAFEHMKEAGIKPNHFTFLALLSACCHGGFIDKGRELFLSMEEEYGLEPCVEHLTCMIDLFCRFGLLSDAHNLLKNVRLEASTSAGLWGALLSSCRLHGNLLIGEAAAGVLLVLEPNNAANYLMLANIYVRLGRREDSIAIYRLLNEKRLHKEPACSWFDGGLV
ncbi:Pentatricopeptide repeat-containing protein [Apostasia shenzhenica]|uniref:Pentatricopeptide repeat-containing protein n=1 Tax=Apostasia shenzhenica TaxID=1088818 RepID=A0A2I0BBV9_9ASPA|nr:Pentatricopeptide repeat-containing protein [Apostasia shenzhenica]